MPLPLQATRHWNLPVQGGNAELPIDHAWGWEPTTIALIKSYRPESSSLGSGQVLLQCPYDFEKARLIVREMADLLALDLVDKGLATDQIVLTVGYDRESLEDGRGKGYHGPVTVDHYGRKVYGLFPLRSRTPKRKESP